MSFLYNIHYLLLSIPITANNAILLFINSIYILCYLYVLNYNNIYYSSSKSGSILKYGTNMYVYSILFFKRCGSHKCKIW